VKRVGRSHPWPFRSAFTGFRFPVEVIVVAVRWYLRYGLSYRDVEELLAERGFAVDHGPRILHPRIADAEGDPEGVVTDAAPVYPAVHDELLPSAWHHVEQYANNPIEADVAPHRLKTSRATAPKAAYAR
jgi:transposase-like protein